MLLRDKMSIGLFVCVAVATYVIVGMNQPTPEEQDDTRLYDQLHQAQLVCRDESGAILIPDSCWIIELDVWRVILRIQPADRDTTYDIVLTREFANTYLKMYEDQYGGE